MSESHVPIVGNYYLFQDSEGPNGLPNSIVKVVEILKPQINGFGYMALFEDGWVGPVFLKELTPLKEPNDILKDLL